MGTWIASLVCWGCIDRRTLADLPWQGLPVRLRLLSRKFVCSTRDCSRQIFTERLPSVAAPYARRTQQALLEGDQHAFDYFGGIFRRLRYDNLACAVKKILRGAGAGTDGPLCGLPVTLAV